MSTDEVNAPPPIEETGPFFTCLVCGAERMVIYGLCPTCADSQDGKYSSKLVCLECKMTQVSEKHIAEWYRQFVFDFKGGMKKDLGIKTITDDGIK